MTVEQSDNGQSKMQATGHPFFELGNTIKHLISEKQWTGLEKAGRDMINHYPEEELGWYALGLALFKLKDYNGAILNLSKSVYLNPKPGNPYYQLGLVYFEVQDYSNSISNFLEALKRGLRSHTTYYNLGNAWFSIGNTKKAIDYYLNSLSVRPDFTPAAYNLFRIYYMHKDYQMAVNTLDPFVDEAELPYYFLAKAKLLYTDEAEITYVKLKHALKLLNSAIGLDDNFALAFYERAYVKARLGDESGFASDKQMAFMLKPELRKGHSE